MSFEDRIFYHFRPRPIGGDIVLSLDDENLHVATGLRTTAMPFKSLRAIQIVFRPASLFTNRYMVNIWNDKGKKVKFSNVTYRGFAEMIEQNDKFKTFLDALHLKLKENPQMIYQSGEPAWRYYPVCLLSIVMALMGLNVIYGSMSQSIWLSLAITAILAYMIHTMWRWVMKNKPSTYSPDKLPPLL